MGKTIAKTSNSANLSRPALTPEASENECIALAAKLAKQQLQDGTASSQVITHYLKLGSPKARLEQQKLEKEIELMDAKAKALSSFEHFAELQEAAIKAMRMYTGHDDGDEEDEE